MGRLSYSEKEQEAVVQAHTFMFGCPGRHCDADESLDPTVAADALTESERTAANYGMIYYPFPWDRPEVGGDIRRGDEDHEEEGDDGFPEVPVIDETILAQQEADRDAHSFTEEDYGILSSTPQERTQRKKEQRARKKVREAGEKEDRY